MFCRKCGHKLNNDAKFCPKCGTEIINRDDIADIEGDECTVTETGIENQILDKGSSDSNKHNEKPPKKRRKRRRSLAIVIICILLFGIQVARYYLGFAISGRDTGDNEVAVTGDGSKNVVYELNPENVKQDEESGIYYVSNIIIVNFKKGVSQEDVQNVADIATGKIVGSIPSINQYQIEVVSKSYNELKSICTTLESQEYVRSAYPDLAVQLEDESIPDDPWGMFGSSWSEDKPSGNNWWVEAINAPSAWDYNNFFESINIGIVDSGFDIKHKDLSGVIKSVSEYNDSQNHGTHVAGIIGAQDNNNIGITGVVWNAQLYTHDWSLTKKQEKKVEEETGKNWTTHTEIFAGIEELVVNCGCKVVNLSLGVKPNKELMTDEFVDASAQETSEFMVGLLENNDFIIVQSAGNGDEHLKPIDTKYNGYFCSISRSNCASSDTVSEDDVLNRIIIVGAAKNEGNNNYSCAYFSNYGENVDIWAPGENIYSTYPVIGYFPKDGTSMAAPVVTGVVALVWEADTSLTGDQVKSIICDNDCKKYIVYGDSDRDFYTLDRYGMVNAQLAVEKALGDRIKEPDDLDGKPKASEREINAKPLEYGGVVMAPEDVALKMYDSLKKGDYEVAAECLDPATEQTIDFFGGIVADIVNFFVDSGMSWGQMLLEAAGATDVEVIECKSYNLEANTNLDIFSNILDKVPGVQNLIYSDADVYVKYRYKYKDEYYVDQDEYHVKRYGWSGWRIEADSMD